MSGERPGWLTGELLSRLTRDGLWAFDRAGVTLFANERMGEMLDVDAGELVGRSLFDFVDGTCRLALETRLQKLGGAAVEPMELCFRSPAGAPLWAMVSLAGSLDGDGELVGGVASVRDIGAEKDIAARLQDAELRLREATAHMPGVIYQIRLTRDRRLRIDYVTEGIFKYVGRSADELMRERANVYDLLHPQDVSFVRERIMAAARNLEPFALAFRVRDGDGGVRHMYTTGSLERLDDGDTVGCGVALDITDGRRAEEQRRTSDARLHALFDNLPFDCWALDRRGELVLQNGASLAEWGDQRGRPLAEAGVPAEVLRDWQADTVRALAGETVRREAAYVIDGAPRYLDRIVAPIRAGRRIVGAVCVNIDLTAQRRLEEQLLQAQKLDALGRIAGGVAHDFNNLLTAILSCVRLLERRLGDTGQRELAIIRDGGERAAALTKQLITFARQETVAPSIVSLGDLVTGVEGLLRRLLGDEVELSIARSPAARVRIDPVRFEQVLVNLAANARDAMPEGGRFEVAIEAALVAYPRPAVDSVVPPGRYTLLRVTDTGAGMSPETAERAFEPFFTTRARSGGTGLGLSTVYGAVRQAGGHIGLTSCVGEESGTTISIYLPEAEMPARQPSTRDRAGGETLLLVEDEPLVMQVVADALVQSGYRVLEATDYASALRVAGEYAGDIHLLVTDVLLPERAGTELARVLAESRPAMAVLFISGNPRDGALPASPGAEPAFLAKPFTAEALVAKVREVLELGG